MCIELPRLTVELRHCFGADEEIRYLAKKLTKIADAMKEEKDAN